MLILESHDEHERHLPAIGKFIIAQFNKESIIVYQAFRDSIAQHAVEHQRFGGDDYDFHRTTWLKPSFLWMMHYSGWAQKENQENVLAIKMTRKGFDEILRFAVMTTFYKEIYGSNASWKKQLETSEVQLQWEPYHDLHGNKTERKAVKIGLSGNMLERFNNEWIQEIKNVTPYVQQQQDLLNVNRVDDIRVPQERAYAPGDLTILTKIDATTISL
ncbi:MAG: hypothetical protein K0R82_1791 [Flavipsychrobacter sp.]|jgi:hypothetical protein|nr:hypothetical protein [Flavipsychrobacter sp.]